MAHYGWGLAEKGRSDFKKPNLQVFTNLAREGEELEQLLFCEDLE
jgi:hypothetical protein